MQHLENLKLPEWLLFVLDSIAIECFIKPALRNVQDLTLVSHHIHETKAEEAEKKSSLRWTEARCCNHS